MWTETFSKKLQYKTAGYLILNTRMSYVALLHILQSIQIRKFQTGLVSLWKSCFYSFGNLFGYLKEAESWICLQTHYITERFGIQNSLSDENLMNAQKLIMQLKSLRLFIIVPLPFIALKTYKLGDFRVGGGIFKDSVLYLENYEIVFGFY